MPDAIMETVRVVIHTPLRSSPIFTSNLQLILDRAKSLSYPRSAVAVAIIAASRSISIWTRPSVFVLRVGCSATTPNPASVSTIVHHIVTCKCEWNKIVLNFSDWRFQKWTSNVHDPASNFSYWPIHYYWNLPNIL